MRDLTPESRALCHRVLRRPEVLESICASAVAGDPRSLDALVLVCWLMCGLVLELEEALSAKPINADHDVDDADDTTNESFLTNGRLAIAR